MNNTFCKNCHRIPSQCVCQPTKPVAYVNSMCSDYINWKVDPMSIDGQSLYTHPVKELTDEEIEEVAKRLIDDCSYCSLHFARAILRKAWD